MDSCGAVGRVWASPGAGLWPLAAAGAGLAVALGGCAAPVELPAPAAVEVVQAAGGYLFRESGRPVLFYRLEPTSRDGEYRRSNYIHPLHGLDGEILTEDFPDDHPHHRGVYWTWHQVLVGEVRAGDPWLARRFSWELAGAEVLEGRGGLRVTHRWHSPDFASGALPIAEETAEVVAHPASGDVRLVDFDIRLSSLQPDVKVGGSEDDKGYGGFSVRVRMLQALEFTAAGGPVRPDRVAMAVGDWVDFSGTFPPRTEPSGVAVFVHPDSAGHPQPWILRSAETPSMQNPVWPGREPAALPGDGQAVRLKYRLVLHRGLASGVDLERLYREYAGGTRAQAARGLAGQLLLPALLR